MPFRRPGSRGLFRRAVVIGSCLMVGGSAAPSAQAAAAAKKATCKAGLVPVVTGSGKRAKVARRGGKVRCAKTPKLVLSRVEPPASTGQGAVASTADQIAQALTVNPQALSQIEAKIGVKATRALLAQGVSGWRGQAGAQARRLSDVGSVHLKDSFGDASKGTAGSFQLDAGPSTADGKLGLSASATVEFTADAKGLKALGADKATDAKSAGVKLEVSFADIPAACPDAAGKVPGSLSAGVKVTLTVDGVAQSISAKLDAKYELSVGDDGRWKTIDKVEVNTEFQFGGSKKGSETWRGRRFGGGFTEKGIFGNSSSFSDNITEQASHLDQAQGGVFGPHTSVNYATGPTAWDIQSISNLKGLIYTEIATQYLTYAAVEYVRKVVADRVQKHWYDDEACLKLEGKPAVNKLKAGRTTTVTASNAKAADGTPVGVNLTASGVASLLPAAAPMAPSATKDFTLTAPNTKPTVSSWKIVGIGKAGKKTVTGTLGDDPAYEIKLDDLETFQVSGSGYEYSASSQLTGTLRTSPVEGSSPAQSAASAPVIWTQKSALVTTPGCELIDPIATGAWSAVVTDKGGDTVEVSLDFKPDTFVRYSLHCVEPPNLDITIPGEPGPTPVGFAPLKFTLPAGGGTQAISGSVLDGGEGFTSAGTVTVTPIG